MNLEINAGFNKNNVIFEDFEAFYQNELLNCKQIYN